MSAQDEDGVGAVRRLVKSKSGLKIVCQHDREAAPWDMAEPAWTPDKEVENCVACPTKFDFLRRRHHCRRCGQIFCGKCTSQKVQFHRMGFVDPVRLCKPCSDVTKKEEDFFNNDLKLLLTGTPMKVSKSKQQPSTPTLGGGGGLVLPSATGALYNVKLASDQKFLLFTPHESTTSLPSTPTTPPQSTNGLSGEQTDDAKSAATGTEADSALGPVDLTRISEIETHESEKIGPGGLTLQVKAIATDPLQEQQYYYLMFSAPPEPSRKPSMQWNGALVKGLRMVLESRYQSELEDD